MILSLLNAICSTGSLAGMAVLTGIHRTNDHIEHMLSAPTGKMYFTLN
jgi:hypothetical protein